MQLSKPSALLATGRVSNLPTVWSNLIVGFLIAGGLHAEHAILLFVACLSASLLYVGGCFLGDAIDVEFDMTHKPTRPIPSGILMRSSIFTSAYAMLSAGTVIPLCYSYLSSGTVGAALLGTLVPLSGSIIAYSIWHKKSPWLGLPLIAACRIFLILTGYAMVQPDGLNGSIIGIAVAVGAYTVSFASVARTESSPSPFTWRKSLITLMLALPLLCFLVLRVDLSAARLEASIALSLYMVWMLSAFHFLKFHKGKFVAMSLAGFCLLDTTVVASHSVGAAVATTLLFGLALLLQRWAPAT
ncbi:UbiA family prenyltransferase [Rubritalea marina]|uniref:UbiA family prenyltransferase n=1 Tax=Rubritalea marina TaxID=361055 RepID=UPI000375812D|nr:hypothetical protein [Rubritalea marina]